MPGQHAATSQIAAYARAVLARAVRPVTGSAQRSPVWGRHSTRSAQTEQPGPAGGRRWTGAPGRS